MCANSRDESLDSGIHSHESTTSDHQPQQQQKMQAVAMRRPQQNRSRRFEMVPIPGRHKFEIRDLSDYNDNGPVIPLSLPKLPTDRKEIVTNGLIRSTNSCNTDSEMDMSISGDSRPTSFISTASETESLEEEKLKFDSSYSEKSLKVRIILFLYAKIRNYIIILGSNSETANIQNSIVNVKFKACIFGHQ